MTIPIEIQTWEITPLHRNAFGDRYLARIPSGVPATPEKNQAYDDHHRGGQPDCAEPLERPEHI